MKKFALRLSWIVMAFLAIGIALAFAAPYLLFNPDLSKIRLNPAVDLQFPIIVIHAVTGGLSLILGPFQFLNIIRKKFPAIHRLMGRIYLICILVGGLAALFSAFTSTSGLVAQIGFVFLAVIWLFSAFKAYTSIRQRQIQQHRIWMMRNYSLTFAAVTLRLWLLVGAMLLRLPFTQVYTSAAWLSWILPLLVVEWFFIQRVLPKMTTQKAVSELQLPVRS